MKVQQVLLIMVTQKAFHLDPAPWAAFSVTSNQH